MHRIAKVWLMVFIGFVCSIGGISLVYGDWSQEWTQNLPPEAVGPFTKMEIFIMPGATSGVTFDAATSIYAAPGSSNAWTSVLPNSTYSLLTGPQASTANFTTYFSGPATAVFDVDFVLWKGSKVVERQEFQWLGGVWANPLGTLIRNTSGGYDAGQYNRGDAVPIPSAILLFAPAGLGVLLLRRRIG